MSEPDFRDEINRIRAITSFIGPFIVNGTLLFFFLIDFLSIFSRDPQKLIQLPLIIVTTIWLLALVLKARSLVLLIGLFIAEVTNRGWASDRAVNNKSGIMYDFFLSAAVAIVSIILMLAGRF